MEKKVLVFYCKTCEGLFFAAALEARVFRDDAETIAQHLEEGHRLALVPLETMRTAPWCTCETQESSKEITNAQ